MTKTDIPNVKNSTELIVYQIGELKAIMTSKIAKDDAYFQKTDSRISALELWQAGEHEKSKNTPQVDVTKILLAAFGLVATALAIIQSGYLKLP